MDDVLLTYLLAVLSISGWGYVIYLVDKYNVFGQKPVFNQGESVESEAVESSAPEAVSSLVQEIAEDGIIDGETWKG